MGGPIQAGVGLQSSGMPRPGPPRYPVAWDGSGAILEVTLPLDPALGPSVRSLPLLGMPTGYEFGPHGISLDNATNRL